MNDLLHLRRQFLLTNEVLDELQSWNYLKIGDVHLSAHPDLDVTVKERSSIFILLIGYIFDAFHPEKTNDEIIADIISKVVNLRDLIATLKPYVGRYALLYRDHTDFAILHDPLGLREIYYCTQPNRVICGSQPNTIDNFSKPKLGVTQDEGILNFYKNDMKTVRSGRAWVGDETYFQNVKHLMPNHYLDIRSLTAKRYWPNRKLENIDLDIAVGLSIVYLKGVLKAVTSRYDVMMAVTSGFDSRSLLAASREVRDRIYYFINKESPMKDSSADIRIPKRMFERLGLPFHVHKVDDSVDEGFKKVFLNNTFMSTDRILPTIYNVYYKNHQDKMNLLGVGELGREYYGGAPHDLNGFYLARNLRYINSRYASTQCEKWLAEARGVAEAYNIDIMKLFLWEGLLGNWGCVGNSESDIAIEEFDPYDSHYIYEIMLSVDQTQGDFFEALFREMWPELLEFPFNPPETITDWIKKWLNQIGLFQPLKRGRYRFDHWRYRRLTDKGIV
jgi:hypothetical protein